ncbi:amino acid adenylation domain-containing protein, partial [Cysteiniphilum sp. 6C5]|uniref:amino acid adenylation domain-containing protein n=1 Tax=unclassified Cysteiniphilum TaxID=2610889 RepID=UPI003F86A1CA
MKMKVIVIGNTGLCLECCKLIVDSPMHELLAVITNDLKLKQWGNQHQIKLLTYAEYQQSDYKNYILLSIVNERIISQAFIERHRIIHAINYHDSLLPTYAGVNSTAWAILNNESSHGVTWHKITQGIDEGDIIQQAKIAITPEDTAHSLNLKCTQQTIVLFKKLLLELSSHTLKGKTQDLTHKTYYGLDHLPQNYGFINTCQSLEDIYRYCRALYFGNDYPNQITSVKIKLENTVYLLGMPVFADAPQTLSDVIGLYIVADEKALHFTTVRNIYGMEVNLSTIVSIEKLGLHKVEFSHHDWHQLKAIKKNEQKQINNALKIAYKANPIVSKATNNNNITKSATCNHSIECQNLSTQQVVSAISLVLMRVAQQDEFLIHFYTNDNCSSHLASLIDSKCFIELSHNNLELPLKDFENLINENLNTKHLLAKDFYYRYQTMNLLTDIGIYHHSSLTYLTDLTHFTDHLTPHRLNFIFDNNSIKMISRDTDILEINAIASSLQVIINQYQQHSKKNTKPNNISLLSKDDYQKIVIDWNKTDKPYPKNKTIHQLFEEQVEKHPNNIAVIFEKKQLTYAQLNAKANQLARYLRSITSIQPDTFIAIALDKSLEMIIGILGILKSGAAYVPIDTSYPDERLKYILDDTQAALVLSQSQYVSRLQDISKASILALDSDCYKSLSIQNLTSISTANNLAYVIYTSGTTGQPKGVMIEHSSLVNMTYSQQENLKISEASRILQFASIGFDASVWEIFGALSFGSRLNILSNAKKSQLKYLENYLLFNEISHATLPPKLIENLDIKFLPKYLCSAGEALNAKTLQKLIGKECFINAYGLTEASVCSTIYKYNRDSLNKNIGKSIDNNKCYVVDVYNNPVPIGVIGELYIGGAGLARGYLNKPELTAEKFIPNPFATETDKANGYDHLYKTGDLVRWLPDGNLEYIGRKDTQIKIRGFRIELAEIESTLINITGIQQAVVINRAINSEQYLFAYYTAKEQTNPELILDKLTKKLPHYMIPSAALQINDIPLTINGKIDIYALPDIGFESTQAYIEPRTEQERIVCQAFSNLLLIEKIGIDDDFFKLGGNSVKAIQLAMVLQSNLEVDIAEIFDLRTPRKLAHNKRITHDLLISKLEQIKYEYISQPIKEHEKLNPTQLLKKEQYLSQITNMPAVKYTAKPIQNVLLTGATGFLGCNLLNQLLTLTSYCIYLCIRAKDKTHAIERMAHKYQFYFDISLEDHFADRIVYIPCDLEKRQIGVSDEQYHQLTKNIDSI